MFKKRFAFLNLSLFDGEGGSEGTASETTGTSLNASKGKGEYSNVKFGKQEGSVAESQPSENPQEITTTLEDRRKAYKDFVFGEYKDIHTDEMQKVINKRFKETKGLEDEISKMKPIVDMLKTRYKTEDLEGIAKSLEDDDSYWSEVAYENDMTVDQYKRFMKLERENKELVAAQQRRLGEEQAQNQLQEWYNEGQALQAKFPNFNLQEEVKNSGFMRMLNAGLPMEHAYKVVHYDELINNAIMSTATATEKKVADNVRAKGVRPAENGTSANSAFTIKDDVTKLTKKDRAEAVRRAMMGEKITF